MGYSGFNFMCLSSSWKSLSPFYWESFQFDDTIWRRYRYPILDEKLLGSFHWGFLPPSLHKALYNSRGGHPQELLGRQEWSSSGSRGEHTSPKFDSSPLKSYRDPMGKDRVPTSNHRFSGVNSLLNFGFCNVSTSVFFSCVLLASMCCDKWDNKTMTMLDGSDDDDDDDDMFAIMKSIQSISCQSLTLLGSEFGVDHPRNQMIHWLAWLLPSCYFNRAVDSFVIFPQNRVVLIFLESLFGTWWWSVNEWLITCCSKFVV